MAAQMNFVRCITLLGAVTLTSACSEVFDYFAQKGLDDPTENISVSGIANKVLIGRDDYGVPYIEADSIDDLVFGIGYAMAEDRLEQMVAMNLLARGRLSEMTGPITVEMDVYMRTLNVPQIIEQRFNALSPEMKAQLGSFANGINAYIESHKDRLPLTMALTGYTPEPWQASNSIGLFVLLNLGVGFNVHEELSFLSMAKQLGAEKAAYLAPIYPDEPIDFAEAKKLSGLTLASADLQSLTEMMTRLDSTLGRIRGQGVAASNNWAVDPAHTRNGASLVANDTHLLLTQPSTWMLGAVKSPEYTGVGISLPGIPALVAGYNGDIAWGETMVMADSMDIFIEQLRTTGTGTEYLYQGNWYPLQEREERIRIKGEDDLVIQVQSTRHGPLLKAALAGPSKNKIIPNKTDSSYGLALSWTAQYPDNTIDAFFRLGQSKNIQQVEENLNDVGFIHLNVIYGDKDNIGWQVTGLYPQRQSGRGHFPSPGWTGEYDWGDAWGGAATPRVLNPDSGYLATGNNRTVEAGFEPVLTNSWYYPERAERAQQMLHASDQHDRDSMIAMQADRTDVLVAKVQDMWLSHGWQAMIKEGIAALPEKEQKAAESIFARILDFDGVMASESANAAVWGMLETQLIRGMFLDELGPDDGDLWKNFMTLNGSAYSGYQDHLLGRRQPDGTFAPFWDDVTTTAVEHPGMIIAQALANTSAVLNETLGAESEWAWGKLITYHWRTDATLMKPHMSSLEQAVVGVLSDYLDRGPYPAGGNRNTLNVAGYDLGKDFEVWNIPAMRMVVDFSQPEPMNLVVAGGASANPASPHYDDGIDLWLSRQNRVLPINDPDKVNAHFHQQRYLIPVNQQTAD
ncbi:penicillin acylase family protein [Thalassolituus oleivorans]|uniref:penicillin acylase family protein n=1 Tax=Thalassolituus oleivorans TaxID=187493 RepID=UPI0023F2A75C|nr:penicillin acylase family protein [Thalassolituus oleivorans]